MSVKKPVHVLIIDDERSSIDVMSSMLESTLHVHVATNAQQGLAILEQRKINIILLDIDLPDISGFDLCKQIKANPNYTDIPVIFISGYNDLVFEIQAYEAGGVDYLTKPISPVRMLIRMSVFLNMRLAIPSSKMIRPKI
ncbi:response regulator [Vibrio sp. TH_r3]|uniref:response regulator n=1 Tax=Vibrio sp. TH_r3 TaxID=3082084 RepID=UPI002953D9C8|nr:response regulator [Vibrio sp. TH_r3]MDV7104835.1 response regulator [Vibrio sp. TH_r3]